MLWMLFFCCKPQLLLCSCPALWQARPQSSAIRLGLEGAGGGQSVDRGHQQSGACPIASSLCGDRV